MVLSKGFKLHELRRLRQLNLRYLQFRYFTLVFFYCLVLEESHADFYWIYAQLLLQIVLSANFFYSRNDLLVLRLVYEAYQRVDFGVHWVSEQNRRE